MSTAAPASATAAASLFLRRSLSSSSPRHVFLPHWVAPIVVARPARLSAVPAKRGGGGVVAAASAAAGSAQFGAGDSENPYEILGISPLDGFDQVKMAYKRRRKDAESNKDAEHLFKLERAYDMVMMEQLQNRKNGVAYGSIQVSKDIKYADNQPVVPWGPRYSRSTGKDLRINMAISATFIMYISTMGHADWKPMQFLCFAYFYRILDKLKATESASTPIYNEYGEVEGRGIHMAKRVLRSLCLVLGSILAVSLGYTGLANFSQFLGQYIPSVVYNFQELIVTTASSVLLCILASYYR
ncbi:protein CHLOROPLAST J-LIKE DOMAIN 1, chloroplastic-like isoform X2 [Oryza glaberrima]|uniref:protein CHLOROPLAST J-LIKE DOMAIN 1, chloroplastic-like isoform X2 n=1 Tax=Oryza glaberrima TaxID=4538 RepID=UPI00224C1E40|nr:protein CHLOROPLAST J-LIKE DOMAIN 1, chloroplastic-like isoform X2 [Oryza glaberrima]